MTATTKFDPAQCLADLLTSDSPSAETIDWLRDSFSRHLAGETFASAFGPGLRDAYQRHQWRIKVRQAIVLLSSPGVSRLSVAKALSAEFSRQNRTQRKPSTEFGQLIRSAIDAYPSAATNPEALWHEVDRYSK